MKGENLFGLTIDKTMRNNGPLTGRKLTSTEQKGFDLGQPVQIAHEVLSRYLLKVHIAPFFTIAINRHLSDAFLSFRMTLSCPSK